MTDLTTFAALQARVYEFLGQQDEATLRAVVDGSARLAIAGAAPPGAAPDVVQQLSALTSEQERRNHLEKLTVARLQKVASALKVPAKGRKKELIDRLLAHLAAPAPAARPAPAAQREPAAQPVPVTQPEPAAAPAAVPDTPPPRDVPTMPDVDPSAVAARLRETETEQEGAEYLAGQRLDHATLLAVAAELQLTRVDRLRQTELEKRVLKQAIGARRKFSGLRKW